MYKSTIMKLIILLVISALLIFVSCAGESSSKAISVQPSPASKSISAPETNTELNQKRQPPLQQPPAGVVEKRQPPLQQPPAGVVEKRPPPLQQPPAGHSVQPRLNQPPAGHSVQSSFSNSQGPLDQALARQMFPPDLAAKVLQGLVEWPQGFDECITELIGKPKLGMFLNDLGSIDGRDRDSAALCLLSIEFNILGQQFIFKIHLIPQSQ